MKNEITNERTYRDLEFSKLKKIVKGFAVSTLGEEGVDELKPTSDKEKIERELSLVSECRDLFEKPDRFTLGEVRDLSGLIEAAQEHPPLEAEDFLTISGSLENGAEAREYIMDLPEEEGPHLKQLARSIDEFGVLRSEVREKIDRRGEIRDTATQRLFNLLKKKRRTESGIKKSLNQFMDDHASLIQDRVVVQRSNRLAIPLRSSAKERVDCVIHGSSNSGRTLFAEPSQAVKLNNELKDLISEIHEEKKRIRGELTDLFLSRKNKVARTQRTVKKLDSVYARAEFSQEYSCSHPRINRDGGINLIDARHPLLDQSEVVPVSIRIGGVEQGATITGPNTGGKTVTLKTIGLLSLMIQSGIPVPASIDSEIEVYDEIYSDIGDEQSIEQSLSTFSSHMGNIVDILDRAESNSLVLLDELGAGTDPEEGAALGLAVLDNLLENGVRFAVTTHYTAIKNYSFNHPNLSTFSVDFDPDELKPTYHILEGVPGKSNAFIIAGRLGLSDEIISHAENFLNEGKIETENIIQELVEEKRKVRDRSEEMKKELERARRIKEEYKEKVQRIKADKRNALQEKIRELDRLLSRAKGEVENAIADSKDYDKEEARESLKRVEDLEGELNQGRETLREEERDKTLSLAGLSEGQRVEVKSAGEEGVVTRIKGENAILVDVNGINLSTELSDLRSADRNEAKGGKGTRSSKVDYDKFSGSAGLELNVRGMTVREALREVDTYLDRLIRADRTKGRILHGKGTGKLRRNIRDHLRGSDLIKTCYGPPPSEGGEGVTVFEL
ncbi:endonuclease MutS2 [Candidatus Bipolaricaulota bacterium]|nr:endonuclease MutS2 [Candidatus Bipolaricaulota bacterium]